MTPAEAVTRLNTVLAHAWMVRTFLKHADEIQTDEGMLDVPRTLYDCIRAVEPARERGDVADFLRRLKGKLPKLRRVADHFSAHFKEFSPHTNFEMAAASLLGVVRHAEEIFAAVDWAEVAKLASGGRQPPVLSSSEPEQGAVTHVGEPPAGSPVPPPAPRSPDPLDDIEIPEV